MRVLEPLGRLAIPCAIALLALAVAGCARTQALAVNAKTFVSAGKSASVTVPVSAAATLPLPKRPSSSTPLPISTMPSSAAGGRIEAQIEAIRRSQDGSRVADFPVGAYQGKNVIIIQVESLNGFLINKKYGGKEITPNINKLIKESWYWPNAYSETGMGNTADAEFIVNTSLYAPQGQAVPVKYENRVLPALPRMLRDVGYYTFTLHTNNVMYWNRKQLYKGLGFNRYYDRAFYHGADRMGGFGSSDEETFKRGFKLLTDLEASGTPFYSQIITVSAHDPYIGTPEKRRPVKTPKDLAGSLMGKYISAESYSDMAIGKFVANLKTTGLWDNSIIVIYGDHTAMLHNTLTGKDAIGAKKLLGRSYGLVDRQRIPLVVHVPGQTAPVLREDVAGQVDIMPTVTDMLGVDLSQVPHMGRSLFVASNSLVPLNAYLRGGSFLNNAVLFMPAKGSKATSVLKVADGRAASASASDKADLKRVQKLVSISDHWVMSLKKFRGGKKGWIPDRAARAAAKPYGFLQAGMG